MRFMPQRILRGLFSTLRAVRRRGCYYNYIGETTFNKVNYMGQDRLNSASRLLNVFDNFRGGQQIGTLAATHVLHQPVGNQANEKELAKKTLVAAIELQRMYERVKDDIGNLHRNDALKETFLEELSELEKVVYNSNLKSSYQPISPASRHNLAVLSAMLDDDEVYETDLESLYKQLDQLKNIADGSGTDPRIRKLIMELARVGRDALDRFGIHGPDGLTEAFKKMSADLSLFFINLTDDDKKKTSPAEWWVKVKNITNEFEWLAKKARQVQPVLEAGKDIVEEAVKSLPQ